jgi:bifunctional non-homologous end joining protein LigD
MRAVGLKRSPERRSTALSGAKRAPMPGFIEPCDPTLRDDAPSGAEWVHEIKIDDYRAQLHIRDRRVKVYSRKGYDWTEQFSQIARGEGACCE